MSDVFISYAREDRAQAKLVAEALGRQGWSVWWDRTMPAGSRYHQVIEEALRGARCVVVIWTANSVGSDWVRAEAGEGLARSVLVPVSLDDAQPPLVFRQIQTADLRGWGGDASTTAFRTLVSDIATLLGTPRAAYGGQRRQESPGRPSKHLAAPTPQQPRAERRRVSWLLLALVAVLALALGASLVTRVGWLDGAKPKPAAEPEIGLLEIVPPRIVVGERAVLRWRTANAAVVEIGGLGTVAMAGERSVTPSANTVYTLVARSTEGRRVEREVEIVVEAATPPPRREPPQIHRFEAAPARVEAGQGAELRWETSGADEVRIADHGPVKPSGGLKVSPRQTTTYTLVATNGGGSTRKEAVVEIAAAPPSPPEIVSFVADPQRVRAGGRAELVWQTVNAKWVELNGRRFDPSGRAGIQPTETTTFVLIAINAAGAKASRRLQVVVEEAPREERLGLRGRLLEIEQGGGADLDAGVAGRDRGEWDLWFGAKTPTARYLYTQNHALIAPVRPGTGNLGSEACTTARLSNEAVEIQGLRRGSEFCLRTSRGRVAWFVVRDSVGPTPDGVLKITYVTLEGP